jgi:hypothetical protein
MSGNQLLGLWGCWGQDWGKLYGVGLWGWSWVGNQQELTLPAQRSTQVQPRAVAPQPHVPSVWQRASSALVLPGRRRSLSQLTGGILTNMVARLVLAWTVKRRPSCTERAMGRTQWVDQAASEQAWTNRTQRAHRPV